MRIEEHTVPSLPQVAARWNRQPGWVPISIGRARALSRNPRADGDDIGLITAEEQGRVVSFIGIVPDRIWIPDGSRKIGWLSSWWLDPAFKPTTVAAELLYRALNAYRGLLGVSTYSESAGRLYKATGRFLELGPLTRMNYIFSLDLARQFWRWADASAVARSALEAAGKMANPLLALVKRYRAAARRACAISIHYLAGVDDLADQFIRDHNQGDLSRRAGTEYDWIRSNPLVCGQPFEDREAGRYPFHLKCSIFQHVCFRLTRPDGSVSAVVLLLRRDDTLDVKYCHYDEDAMTDLLAALWGHALRYGVRRLSLYDPRLHQAVEEHRMPYLYKTERRPGPLVGKVPGSEALGAVPLHGGDGDSVLF